MSEGITDYARMLVLIDDVKRLEREKNLIITCRDLEMKDLRAENARLRAEVERLKMEESKLLTLCETYEGDLDRLRKAGDKLVEAIQEMDVIIDMDSEHPEINAWNAAKEGKPHA